MRRGRVEAADAGRFLLDTGRERLVLDGEARPGDWIEVEQAEDGREALSVQVLNRPRASSGFPAPGGEWYRLRRDGGARFDNLAKRARALSSLRSWFAARDYLEIEAPLLVPSPGLEVHLDAYSVDGAGFLITSPEYQLKRLLAAGLPAIYALGRCFRRGEAGPRHNPEFTMCEWYRAFAGWDEIAREVESLCAHVVAEVAGSPRIVRTGEPLDLTPPWEWLTVREAMRRYAQVDLDGDEPVVELVRKARAAGHAVPEDAPWDDVFFSVFVEVVEPRLGRGRPTMLHDWPAPLCALARPKPGDPRVVERFEAYAGGLELCNGFGELIDPVEQRRRCERDLAERRRRGLPLYPLDERFLGALDEGLPPSAGVALGVDRLVMLATGARAIREVSAFTSEEL